MKAPCSSLCWLIVTYSNLRSITNSGLCQGCLSLNCNDHGVPARCAVLQQCVIHFAFIVCSFVPCLQARSPSLGVGNFSPSSRTHYFRNFVCTESRQSHSSTSRILVGFIQLGVFHCVEINHQPLTLANAHRSVEVLWLWWNLVTWPVTVSLPMWLVPAQRLKKHALCRLLIHNRFAFHRSSCISAQRVAEHALCCQCIFSLARRLFFF